jgi:putative endonuclease
MYNLFMWHVYILRCADGTFYTGITTDLERRLVEHNSSVKGAKYTRERRPVSLGYSCEKENKSEAAREEYRIRTLTRLEKLSLIGE